MVAVNLNAEETAALVAGVLGLLGAVASWLRAAAAHKAAARAESKANKALNGTSEPPRP